MLWLADNVVVLDCQTELSLHYVSTAPREGQFDTARPYQVPTETDKCNSERNDALSLGCFPLPDSLDDNKIETAQANASSGRCGPVEPHSSSRPACEGGTSDPHERYGT